MYDLKENSSCRRREPYILRQRVISACPYTIQTTFKYIDAMRLPQMSKSIHVSPQQYNSSHKHNKNHIWDIIYFCII